MVKITTDIQFKDAINIFKPFFEEILLTCNNEKESYLLTNNEEIAELIISNIANYNVNYNADPIMEKQQLTNQFEGLSPNDLF